MRPLLFLAVALPIAAFASRTVAAPDSPQGPAPAPASSAVGGLLDHLSFSAGASDWSGDFGAQTDTDFTAVLISARYKLGGLRLSASVPYMRIDSAGAFFAGIEGTPLIVAPSATSQKIVRDGLGDMTLGASYLVPSITPLNADLDLSARVKVPTASRESGLSTGKADYAFGAELSKPFGRFVPYASVTYRSFGDTAVWRLKDGFATSVGLSYVFNGGVVGVLSYDFAQKASRFIDDSHEIVGSLSTKIPRTPLRLTAFAGGGLSDGAADVSGGLSLSLGI